MTAEAGSDQTRSRYPGTRPFNDSPGDVARFFGRGSETEELHLRVISVPLLVQFGKSGLGKTSLLQAGLFPLLRREPYLPVMVRLNVPSESLTAAVQRAIAESCALEGLRYEPGAFAGLWELLDDFTVWRGDLLLTPVLVLDQFEEVFTLRDAVFRRELADELGALATGIAPPRLDPRAPRPDLKIVISLREDYLGSLEEFAAAIPGLFDERLRLEPLAETSARTAITAPALLDGDYDSPPFEYDPAALEAMIAYLKGASGVIEPFQLQLLCRHAEKIATRKGGPQREKVTITLADFHQGRDFASVLDRFYRDTLGRLPPRQRRRAARLCEEGLLGAGGHRLMLEERQIVGDYAVSPQTLQTLAGERLIRREPRQESVFYEISHDRVAEAIRDARRSRLPRKVKRALWAAALAAAVILAGLFAWNRSVRGERDRAEASLQRAERLIGFLLGEQFLGEVRDTGRTSLLQLVQDRVRAEQQTPFNRGLALRNSGDIERTMGRIENAIARFAAALPSFDARSSNPLVVREAARTHERLGDALEAAGRMREALAHHDQAVAAWRRVVSGPGTVLTDDCISLAGSIITAAAIREQLGETNRPLADLEDASEIVFQTLFGHGTEMEKCAPGGRTDLFPRSEALQTLSRAASSRARLLDQSEDYDGAAALARQASTLRPPSMTARQRAFVAQAMRGNGRLSVPLDAIEDYQQAVTEADTLRRWDPGNRFWLRERAAVQLLLAEGIIACHTAPETPCDPMPPLVVAQATSLEALATMRALALSDPLNASLQGDLAWSLVTYARTIGSAERLPVLEEALRSAGRTDARDRGAHHTDRPASILYAKAATLAELKRSAEALTIIRHLSTFYEQLSAAHPDSRILPTWLADVRELEASILDERGDAAGARGAESAMDQALARLEAVNAPFAARLERLNDLDHTHRDAGIALMEKGDHAGAVRELMLSEAAVREYARAQPADFGAYRDLHRTYEALATAHRALGHTAARGAALRASMLAAQLAAWLATPDQQEMMELNLLSSRVVLAGFLREQRDHANAAAMVREAAAVAESLAQRPDAHPAYVHALGETTCIVGDILHQTGETGWKEAYLSGIIHLERAAEMNARYAPSVGDCERRLASARSRVTPPAPKAITGASN